MIDKNTQQVVHNTINGKYRIVFEQAAVKGVLGFKVEANGDDFDLVKLDVAIMLAWAKDLAPAGEGK